MTCSLAFSPWYISTLWFSSDIESMEYTINKLTLEFSTPSKFATLCVFLFFSWLTFVWKTTPPALLSPTNLETYNHQHLVHMAAETLKDIFENGESQNKYSNIRR